jgi:hypothetical protein
MRLLAALACLALSACSSSYELPQTFAPEPSKATEGAKKGANDEKLVGPVEVSGVRQASPIAPGVYMSCIRGTNPTVGLRYYSVFFKNNDYVSSRMSVITESCETQAFIQLGSAPF